MSHSYPEEVIKRTKEYISFSSHWSSSDIFADKTFNRMFEERYHWILNILMDWAKDENIWIRNAAAFAIHAPVEKKILNKNQFLEGLQLLDVVMEDPAKNVQKKTAWALRVVGKYYPEETYKFLEKWAKKGNNNTMWIIKNSVKFLDKKRMNNMLKLLG